MKKQKQNKQQRKEESDYSKENFPNKTLAILLDWIGPIGLFLTGIWLTIKSTTTTQLVEGLIGIALFLMLIFSIMKIERNKRKND